MSSRAHASRARFVLLVGPCVLVLLLLTIVPAVLVIAAAFMRWSATDAPKSIGLANFRTLLHDDSFWNALRVTAIFVAITAVAEFAIGTLGAVAVHALTRGRNLVRMLLALPLLVSPVVAAIVWKLALNEQAGIFTALLQRLTPYPVAPLSSPTAAIYAVAAIDVWQWTPFVLLLLSLALDEQQRRYGDVISVDALPTIPRIRRVWAPLLLPTTAIVMSLRAVDALKVFDIIQIATAGGPGGASEVLSLYDYKQLIKFTNFGYAAAISVILLLLASGIWAIAAPHVLRTDP